MADHGLIVGTVFAHRAVDDLEPGEKAELLETAHREGWEFVTRSISEAPALYPSKQIEGQVMDVDLVEYWYFKRARL